jgi:C1A family cysteine protease
MSRLLAFCMFITICAAISQNADVKKQFTEYMQKHGKSYATVEEYNLRLKNFEASLERIALENARSKKATFGLNKFSDMSREEFRNTVLMKNPINPQEARRPNVETLVPKKDIEVPSSFDWRTKGAVTPVKDQEQCGSCWAFSVTENVESMWILAKKANASTLRLSEQQIVDCDLSDDGCNGGDPPTAYQYLINAGGQEAAKYYPYTAEDGDCAFNKSDVIAKISSWKYATSDYSETTLQANLLSWGPLSICVDAANWQDYQKGVMSWEDCAWFNQLDHCVQLVGYNTNSASDGDYWIVRNSWNTDWGIAGYIWLEMWEDTCGLTYEATSSVI